MQKELTALQEAIQWCKDLQLDLMRNTGQSDITLLTAEVKLVSLLDKEKKQMESAFKQGTKENEDSEFQDYYDVKYINY